MPFASTDMQCRDAVAGGTQGKGGGSRHWVHPDASRMAHPTMPPPRGQRVPPNLTMHKPDIPRNIEAAAARHDHCTTPSTHGAICRTVPPYCPVRPVSRPAPPPALLCPAPALPSLPPHCHIRHPHPTSPPPPRGRSLTSSVYASGLPAHAAPCRSHTRARAHADTYAQPHQQRVCERGQGRGQHVDDHPGRDVEVERPRHRRSLQARPGDVAHSMARRMARHMA